MNKSFLMLMIALMCGSVVFSQEIDPSSAIKNKMTNAVSTNARAKFSSPFGASSLPNIYSNVSLSSFFKEGANGKIELQGEFNSGWTGGITIDQKIGKSTDVATPLDLSGISPGTTVKLNIQKQIMPSFILLDAEIKNLNIITRAYEARKSLQPNTSGLLEISKNGTVAEKQAAEDAIRSVRLPWVINAEVGFTKTAFAYATDSLTLKENRAAFLTPTVKVGLVKAIGSGFNVAGYAALNYIYSESYNAGTDLNFMIPFGSSRNYYTGALTFGKPTKVKNHNLSGEFRKNISIQNNTNMALSPTVTFGLNTRDLGIFLPVYFIKGSDEDGKPISGLQGGVRFGYITNTKSGQGSSFRDGFIAQLIISQPLDFLDRL